MARSSSSSSSSKKKKKKNENLEFLLQNVVAGRQQETSSEDARRRNEKKTKKRAPSSSSAAPASSAVASRAGTAPSSRKKAKTKDTTAALPVPVPPAPEVEEVSAAPPTVRPKKRAAAAAVDAEPSPTILRGGPNKSNPTYVYEMPRWARLLHAPSWGVDASSSSTTTSSSAASSDDDNDDEMEREYDAAVASRLDRGGGRTSTKDMLDAPPTKCEIRDLEEHLRRDAYRTVSGRIDAAVRRALSASYSSEEAKSVAARSSSRPGSKAASEASRSGETTGLAEEVNAFFDLFRPPSFYDDEGKEVDFHEKDEDQQQRRHDLRKKDQKNEEIEAPKSGVDVSPPIASPPGDATAAAADDRGTTGGNGNEQNNDSNGGGNACAIGVLLRNARHDPRILPVAVVRCHPSILDRAEVVRSVLRSGLVERRERANLHSPTSVLSSSPRKPNDFDREGAMVCILRNGLRSSASFSNSGPSHGDLLAEVVSQCLSQEPDPAVRSLVHDQRKRRRAPGCLFRLHQPEAESLLEWAGSTEAFNSVVVVFENPETIPPPALDAFVATATELRSCHGMPISLVVVGADQAIGDRLSSLRRSSLGGGAGVAVRDFRVSPPNVLLDHLLENLYLNPKKDSMLPVLLGGSTLNYVRKCFVENDGSVVSAAMHFKLALGHHFATPGSCFSLSHSASFVSRHWQRLAWLCVEKAARPFIIPPIASGRRRRVDVDVSGRDISRWIKSEIWRMRSFSMLCRLLDSACRMFLPLFERGQCTTVGYKFIEDCFTQSQDFKQMVAKLFDSLERTDIKKIAQLFIDWKQTLAGHLSVYKECDATSTIFHDVLDNDPGDAIPPLLSDLVTRVNRYLVLLDAFSMENGKNSLDNIRMELLKSIASWVRCTFGSAMTNLIDRGMEYSPLSALSLFSGRNVLETSIGSEPRRNVAFALANPPEGIRYSHAEDSGILFNLGTSRIMTTADWYEEFRALTVGGGDSDERWIRFAFAVYQLEHCGIFQRLPITRRKEITFEKVACVWTSGK